MTRRKQNNKFVIENEAVTVNPHLGALKSAYDTASANLTAGINPTIKNVGTVAIVAAALYFMSRLPDDGGSDEGEFEEESDDDDID